jgi:DNA mismatch repair ATPase MutS
MTPVRQQYLRIKKQFPNAIVMFRLGDFYETFDDDAKIVSSVCNIVLTSREMGTSNRVPLAGVPYHALDNYLAKPVNAGHKVAIVEQTGTEPEGPQTAGRTPMTREVTRYASPRCFSVAKAVARSAKAAKSVRLQAAGDSSFEAVCGEEYKPACEVPEPRRL